MREEDEERRKTRKRTLRNLNKKKKKTTTTTTKTIYYTDYITLNLKITKGQITAYALNSGRKKLNEPKGLNSGETLS